VANPTKSKSSGGTGNPHETQVSASLSASGSNPGMPSRSRSREPPQKPPNQRFIELFEHLGERERPAAVGAGSQNVADLARAETGLTPGHFTRDLCAEGATLAHQLVQHRATQVRDLRTCVLRHLISSLMASAIPSPAFH
jgi:hypothetical protein